ncbi:MAG TPA: AAA family ATPase [Microscillaceae bacterium]|jgi:hypothetical protein|nr:AAA family ATPase [Microscillaceae bacterium]
MKQNFEHIHQEGKFSYQFLFNELIDYQGKIEYPQYFVARNGYPPHLITFYEHFNTPEMFELLVNKYQIPVSKTTKYRRFDKKEEKIILSGFFIELQTDLHIYCNDEDSEVRIMHGDKIEEAYLNELITTIRQSIGEMRAESKIFLLYESQKTLCLRDFEVKKNNIDLQRNYNDDFATIHELIVNRLNTANDKGLVLLYGVPGTGKTSYIRYLTSLINKRMIYIPPDFAYKIASPDFLPLLISNPNSVLIIEDAEDIVEARETGRNISVSNLLNLADGLLSDCLNIQILCTFNTHISNIDTALLRKGRLIATYEFKPLAAPKAQELSNQLGFETKIERPMSLADIYNQHDQAFAVEKGASIGF